MLSVSESRVLPICEIYEKCGGCNIQHMNYKEQIRFKESKIINTLNKIGDIRNIKMEKFYAMSIPYEYRNKVQVPFGLSDSGVKAGFYEKILIILSIWTSVIYSFTKVMILLRKLENI